MAELADALDSGSSEGNFMKVQVLLPAPNFNGPSLFAAGKRFGLFYFQKTNGLPRHGGASALRRNAMLSERLYSHFRNRHSKKC